MLTWLSNPAVVSAIVTGLFLSLWKAYELYTAKKKEIRVSDYSMQQLLSMEQADFRKVLIEQYHECKKDNTKLEEQVDVLKSEILALKQRINTTVEGMAKTLTQVTADTIKAVDTLGDSKTKP